MSEFLKIDLSCETHTVAPGKHLATISEARVITNRAGDIKWLFVTLDTYTADGELLGPVEDRFITIAAKPGAPSSGKLQAGLKRLAVYGQALEVDFNGRDVEQVPALLVGRRVLVVVSRYGSGVQAENRIVTVLKEGA